jgi:DNA-nicking Smr family endonuclease
VSKKEKPFHNPFADAQKKLEALVKRPDPPARPTPKPTPKSGTGTGTGTRPQGDDLLFSEEMRGVAPLAPDPRGRIRSPDPAPAPKAGSAARDDAEAYAALADLIEGHGDFDIADTDEYIEGIAPGLDKRILKRLRKGEYALQGHLDLHGLTRDEARAAVVRFIDESRAAGKRCVLLIHGRGLNSKDQIPILKERVKAWLERGRVARAVLAFATARPCDGGAGAVYVLLRR